jgi:hypothetical protein
MLDQEWARVAGQIAATWPRGTGWPEATLSAWRAALEDAHYEASDVGAAINTLRFESDRAPSLALLAKASAHKRQQRRRAEDEAIRASARAGGESVLEEGLMALVDTNLGMVAVMDDAWWGDYRADPGSLAAGDWPDNTVVTRIKGDIRAIPTHLRQPEIEKEETHA